MGLLNCPFISTTNQLKMAVVMAAAIAKNLPTLRRMLTTLDFKSAEAGGGGGGTFSE